MKVKMRTMRLKARMMKIKKMLLCDVYEDQEDCDVLLEVDVLERLVALPR